MIPALHDGTAPTPAPLPATTAPVADPLDQDAVLHSLVKAGAECAALSTYLGTFCPVSACAAACRNHLGCAVFAYGKGRTRHEGKCF